MEPQESSISRQVEPRNGSTWTVDEDALLIRLKSSSASWEEITDRIGRTEYSCKIRCRRIMAQARQRVDKNELARLYDSHKEQMWTKVANKMSPDTSWIVAELNHWSINRSEMAKRVGKEFLTEAPDPVYLLQLEAKLAKNDEAQVQSQQQDQQQSTHNSPWSGHEEAILLAKYRANLKWNDISTYFNFPERTPKACELHYSFLLKRCGGWSPELQNKLCKVYERLKQEMWIPIGEAMSVSWQTAEELHWEIGKGAMAERAGASLIPQPAADLALAPREPGQTTKEWLNLVCQ
ncbi:related to DRPLA protein [Claviceps purpurea 20.1]|uniref:Related to DRPLA protein n=1 Tax=Claviceps purpurea (strain 20.1) TaxID=1111077 RepID=M1WAN3_CLAP2|nr:related to DRPLA protein [Claviceps purpurea 20.1]